MEAMKGFMRNAAFNAEADAFFNEYHDLTGENFPPCDREHWSSLDDWFTDLKLAVYRQRAIKEIYGGKTA